MPIQLTKIQLIKYASITIGAFFCLCLSACEKKSSTPDWSTPPTQEKKDDSSSAAVTKQAAAPLPKRQDSTNSPAVRFVAYNLRNYLTMRRYTNGKASYTSKPETEITQLIQILKEAHPDILGVCEIGRNSDLKDLQKKLKQAGINLPYTHRAYGADEVRSLAILSRYPISSWTLPRQMTYTLNNHPFKISRGILDVTIQLPEKKVRFLGVHLKSKRPIEEADQELVRRNESLLLRKHIDDILTSAPETLLMVYGDFNDTKRSKAVRTAKGRSNSKKHMAVLELSDSRGENWTHNWKREDIYSRFDYVMVNRKLAPLIDLKTSRVLDPENGYLASDHRPLLVIIR